MDLTGREIWLRVAEVFTGAIPPDATGFQLGLEGPGGAVAWVGSDEAGGVARPYDRSALDWKTKTMLHTLRFNPACFKPGRGRFNVRSVRAIRLRLDRPAPAALAFDDLQIVPA